MGAPVGAPVGAPEGAPTAAGADDGDAAADGNDHDVITNLWAETIRSAKIDGSWSHFTITSQLLGSGASGHCLSLVSLSKYNALIGRYKT